MKKIVIILFIFALITGCLRRDLTLLEIFEKNDYKRVNEQTFEKELEGGMISAFYFDEENVDNNYFEFDNGSFKIKYFYKTKISQINECIYDVANDSFITDNDNCQDYINFLRIIKEPYQTEILELKIKEEDLYILKSDLK